MENLVGLISLFYIRALKDVRFVHQPHEGSRTGFGLELRIGQGVGVDECEVIFAPAPTTDISGGRYQEVPDIYGATYGQFSNRIDYRIERKGNLLKVTGPLLKNENYPAVFPVVQGMHKILTERVGLQTTEREENMFYTKNS